MTYNFSGVEYRLWAVYGVILVLGCLCMLVSWYKKSKRSKEGVIVGALTILYALGLILCYCNYLANPIVESITATFMHEERNSRVAPPLPFTMEYQFSTEITHVFYLDTLSKREIFPYSFEEGEEYIIYYEKNTKIIVGVEQDP